MTSISANGTDVNRSTPPSIPVIAGYHSRPTRPKQDTHSTLYKANYIYKRFQKHQFVLIIIKSDEEAVAVMSAIRGNGSYNYKRKKTYEQWDRGLKCLTNVDTERKTTNRFFFTLTYSTDQENPPQELIGRFRRQLKAKGIHNVIITQEANTRGYIHHHGEMITDEPLDYFHQPPTKKTPHWTNRSTAGRDIIQKAWREGYSDCQAIIDPDAATAKYVMKELLKQAQCEKAVKKIKDGEEINEHEKKQINTLYWAMKYNRRLVSVSPGITKAGELPNDEGDTLDDDLINTWNNSTKTTTEIITATVPRLRLWALFKQHGHPPPRYTGDIITDPKIIAEIRKIAEAERAAVC